jgi:hypothetical protein
MAANPKILDIGMEFTRVSQMSPNFIVNGIVSSIGFFDYR